MSSFTLVELLVVLVIIGMLAGLGLTAMHHIGRATALATGARQFANDVTLARQYAVANSTYLLLVVADVNTGLADYSYSAYGFYAPSNYVGAQVIATNNLGNPATCVEDIRYLPKGVVFSSTMANVFTTNILFPCDSTTQRWVSCVTFTPNGQILPLGRRPTFTLFEGVVNASFQPVRTGTSTNNYQIEINPLIGKPIVTKFP